MSVINLLDANTINKIAAGEVLERPASCVKELVENSIDAGATRIEVEIQNGGKDLIRVTDNGRGMGFEDASLSIRRHATSKIKSISDIERIKTLGFRGEALPTITSVSKFTMNTRCEGKELGTEIKLQGGKNEEIRENGCALGTTIKVEELFFNTPARKKFLKTTNTEGSKIHEYIVKLSLSHPEVKFRMINGTREVLTTPGNGNILDTITSIYGNEISESLMKVDLTDKYGEKIKVSGYITKPNIIKSYRSWQTFIVNGRIVNNRIISKAVDEAYKSLIPKIGYPLAILIIEVPNNFIDVNVHPQKTEIRFEDEGKIYKIIHAAITQAINDKSFEDDEESGLAKIAVVPEKIKPQFKVDERELFNRELDKKIDVANVKDEPEKIQEDTQELTENLIEEEKSAEIKEEMPETFNELQNKSIEPIGQASKCYIIASDGDGIYIVDQHAAHERILFDRLSSYAETVPAQQLLVHQILRFDERESELIEQNLEVFQQLGFTLEMSGKQEFRLIEVPTDIKDVDVESIMREILSELTLSEKAETGDDKEIAKKIRQACLAVTACRGAIKAGQELNLRQMERLLEELNKTSHPYTCPHGRPTIIKFTTHDLDKMFKRTGF